MYRITLLLTLVLLIPDVYIYIVHIVRKTKNTWLRLSYWMPSIIILAAYIYFMYLAGDNPMANHTQAIGRIGTVALIFIVSKLLFIISSACGLLLHTFIRSCPRVPFNIIGVILGLIGFGSMLYGSVWGITRFEVKEVEYRSALLPEGFDGYRIVQISDLHLGSWQGNPAPIQRLVDLVNRQHADLIVFTGDLVNQQSHEVDGFQPILSRIHAPDGVYSILGNHDYGSYYRWENEQAERDNLAYLIQQQEAMGWRMLNNGHDIIRHRGDSIALIGVENDGEPPFPQYADLPRAIRGTEGMFQILLSHNPTHWRREVLPTTHIPLMLAGHTHAMQAIVFGRSLAPLKYPEWQGMYYEGDRALYVNIGIGYVGLPFRLGAWPEVTVLTLRKE